MGSCPSGYENLNGVCTSVCPGGYDREEDGSCVKKCKKDYPNDYYRGSGWDEKQDCENVNGSECEKCGELYYVKCLHGYRKERDICSTCVSFCDDEVIKSTSTEKVLTFETIIMIAFVLFIVSGLIYYVFFQPKRVNRNTITSIVIGNPGSDIYSQLRKPNERLYYV